MPASDPGADPSTLRTGGIVLIGPYPPYRGGIAHFTSSLHDQLAADGRAVKGISFSRQYPSLLFPGKSQREPGSENGRSSSSGPRDVEEIIDSVRPASWRRAAAAAVQVGAQGAARGVATDTASGTASGTVSGNTSSEAGEAVFMYWMPFFAPAYAAMAARLRQAGMRVTALVHNASPHEKMPFGRMLAHRFFLRCDRLVAISDTVASELRAMDPGPPVETIAHPVYDRFGAGLKRSVARDRLALSEDIELMLFFGLVRRYKGLDVLIDAMGELAARRSRLHLIVAGEFYEDRRAAEERLAHLGIGDRVTLLDRYISDEDVPLYFSAADVVVQPYRSATQSGVVQTAFQFGRPVIVTDVGELGRTVRHDVDGLVVPPADQYALASAIERFFGEQGLCARLTSGASATEDRMTWTEFTRRLFD